MPLPTRDYKGMSKFKDYRKKGLSYRDIEKLMGKSLKTLARWNKYLKESVGDLSTGNHLTVNK